MERMAGEGYRSLADQLRAWSDQQLSRLLLARPDLATPAPQDSGQLASRSATRASLTRALDQLSRVELCVLDALVVAGQTTPSELLSLVHASRSSVEQALDRLLETALVWESTGGLRALTGVAELLVGGPTAGPSGLKPRSTEPLTAEQVRARLAEISAEARVLLEHVLAHGGEATTDSSRHTVLPDDARTPAEELLSRRLLVPRGGGTVVLPGEVGLVLRGGHTTLEPVDVLPEVPASAREQSLVDKVAAGAAFEIVRRVELLLDHWGTQPPTVLRSGGLAVRDLKAAEALLQVDERTTALVVEVAHAAGLLAIGTGPDGDPAWLPTDELDRWVTRDAAERWQVLARAWLDSPRLPALVGQKDPAGKTWNALVPELTRSRPACSPWASSARCPPARCWPPAPGSRAWSRGSPGCARAAPAPAPTRCCGPSRRPPCWASPGSAGSPPSPGRCSRARTRRRCSPRSCPHPSTTSWCRQT